MKTDNLKFESILLILTTLFSFDIFIYPNLSDITFFLFWLWILSIVQIFHSLFIGAFYWKIYRIRICLIIYWVSIVLECVLLKFLLPQKNNDCIDIVVIFIFPLLISLFMWFITFYFRRRKIVTKQQ
jgi:hypothetical protein